MRILGKLGITGVVAALVLTLAVSANADPIGATCTGTAPDANGHVQLDCVIPMPQASTVTVTTPVPTTVTVTETVTETVTVTPSPTAPPTTTPPASPSPSPSTTPTTALGCPAYPAMPDASCTGYAHTGVTLRDCPLKITAPGTYDGCRFKGTLVIASAGVTVTRSLVQGGHVEGSPYGWDLRGVVLQDVTVVGPGNDGAAAVGNSNYTCRRCDISGGLRGFAIGDNVLIEESYAHDFWVQSKSQRDSNSVHQTAASTHGGSNIRILHSTLICKSDAYACSAAMSLYSEDAPGIDNVLIEKTYFATDAGFGLFFASLVSGKPYGITNTRVIDCVFGPSEYGPVANFPRTQSGNVWSGNRLESGTAI